MQLKKLHRWLRDAVIQCRWLNKLLSYSQDVPSYIHNCRFKMWKNILAFLSQTCHCKIKFLRAHVLLVYVVSILKMHMFIRFTEPAIVEIKQKSGRHTDSS